MKGGVTNMQKTLVVLSILAVFGLLLGGAFLFGSITSVDVSEEDFVETLGPITSYDLCDNQPGEPDPCNQS